jgi:hypothetical protein
MNRILSAVLLSAAALSTSAFADARYDAGPVMTPAMGQAAPAASTSRAAVQAELAHATQSGEIAYSHTAYPALQHMMPVATTVSRADVKAELARASAAHEIEGDRHS